MGAIAASTGGAESCRRVSSEALDLCSADKGINSPNQGQRRSRIAPAVCEGETGGEAACAEGAGSCRRLLRRVRDLHGERRAQTSRILPGKAPR
jgi:hypothetical protein